MLIRCAAILAVGEAAASSHRSDHGSCDTGEIAAALNTLPGTLTGQDLFNLCISRFSPGICFAAGQTLRAQLSDRAPGDVSVMQFASSACSAVEAARNSQQALLQRSAPAEMDLAARAAALAAMRSSPQAQQLSMNVAENDESDAAEDESEHFNKKKTLNLDDVLHRKAFSFPHDSFDWEQNHTTHPSLMMQEKVAKWMSAHALKIDVGRPDIKYRTKFFKKFEAGKNYDVIQAGDQSKVPVDISTLEDGNQKQEGPLKDDGSRSWFNFNEQSADAEAKEGVPKQAPSGHTDVEMTALGTVKEAQTLNRPVTKNFLASHKELNGLLSQVLGKGKVTSVSR
jgi:hypothetical protein